MSIAYLDTSAALRLVVEEPESEALTDEFAADPHRRLISSWLLHTEMHVRPGAIPMPWTWIPCRPSWTPSA